MKSPIYTDKVIELCIYIGESQFGRKFRHDERQIFISRCRNRGWDLNSINCHVGYLRRLKL